MEPEAEDPDNKDNMVTWSGSDGSGELYEDASDEEYPLDQGFPKCGARTPGVRELSLGGAREEKCNGGLMV